MIKKPLVRIVTDTSARLPSDWAEAHHVTVLPNIVTMDGHAFREDIDIGATEFARRVTQSAQTFEVSAPSIEDLSAAYRAAAQGKSDVISLHASSAMSNAQRNARIAREAVSGRCTVHVVETRTMAMGLHKLVQAAVEMSERGMSADDIVRQLRSLIQGIYAIFASDDMQYLQHSGRLRPAQAWLGRMLEIIPCLTMEEGDLVAVEKVRSPERALEKLAEFACEFDPGADYAIVQLDPQPGSRSHALMDALRSSLRKADSIPVMTCGAMVGRIIGRTGIGIMIYEGDAQSL
jgi:DegV family protein with EDD domain